MDSCANRLPSAVRPLRCHNFQFLTFNIFASLDIAKLGFGELRKPFGFAFALALVFNFQFSIYMIKDKQLVTVIYDLFVDGEKEGTEELMERATVDNPLVYCHGMNMMLPSFEQQLSGLDSGAEFDFRIPYNDAYGEYDDEAVRTLPRRVFENDGELDSRVTVDAIVPMTTEDGSVVPAQVVEITDEHVIIDLNHPLAGENLHFKGKIIGVRDAADEDIAKLMNGGCGGCGGCGGNCGEGCGSGCSGCDGN